MVSSTVLHVLQIDEGFSHLPIHVYPIYSDFQHGTIIKYGGKYSEFVLFCLVLLLVHKYQGGTA